MEKDNSASEPSRPIHLILDFDKTITTKDTIQLLGAISYEYNHRPGGPKGLWPTSRWNECVEAYQKEYNAHIASYSPKEADRITIEAEIVFQRSLRDVETRSVERISSLKFFVGIGKEDWKQAAEKEMRKERGLEVRKGWKDVVRRVEESGNEGRWGIVSVNWCDWWIRGVVGEALGGEKRAQEMTLLSNCIRPESGLIVGADRDALVGTSMTLLFVGSLTTILLAVGT